MKPQKPGNPFCGLFSWFWARWRFEEKGADRHLVCGKFAGSFIHSPGDIRKKAIFELKYR
jgi:hypothetical protein